MKLVKKLTWNLSKDIKLFWVDAHLHNKCLLIWKIMLFVSESLWCCIYKQQFHSLLSIKVTAVHVNMVQTNSKDFFIKKNKNPKTCIISFSNKVKWILKRVTFSMLFIELIWISAKIHLHGIVNKLTLRSFLIMYTVFYHCNQNVQNVL